MDLEVRGNSQYYYRKRRLNGRLISEYLGSADTTKLHQYLQAVTNQERLANRLANKALWQPFDDAFSQLKQFS